MIENKKIGELITKTLDDVFKNKTIKCSMYLSKYIHDKDKDFFNKFFEILVLCQIVLVDNKFDK